MNYKGKRVQNQCMNCECVRIVMQICCYSKCGIGLQGFNPHLLVHYMICCKLTFNLQNNNKNTYIETNININSYFRISLNFN